KIRSLATTKFLANVPKQVDRCFFFIVGLGTHLYFYGYDIPWPQNQTCQGPNNTKLIASINHVSF
ncbi:hypothetical protein J1N35_041088, partial [Gossypium stocksii]